MPVKGKDIGDFLANVVARGALGVALALPYRWRIPLFGRIMSSVIAPIAGYRKRVRSNLAHVLPDLPKEEVERLCREVPDNTGRSLIEIYSGAEFKRRAADMEIEGSGLKALEQARDEGRPVVLVTGHFGNYDAPRAALIARGFNIGALYRPMSNRFFNAHYVRSISEIGTPIFAQGRRGMGEMVKFLKSGGVLGFFIDNHVTGAEPLDFFGQPAPTSLAAAEMALKYDALLLSTYGIRQPDGLSFKIVVNAPVEHSTPVEMMQVLSDELEELVTTHMSQWFWIHRRWKPERQRTLAAAKIGP